MSEQCRVKLTAERVKSQGGVVGIEDIITSLFLKPTACRKSNTLIFIAESIATFASFIHS